ncbi:MAG: exodeoxyribonuclease VII small subunit [Myxococcaceae bacterium]
MARENKPSAAPEKYGEVVTRLEDVVKRLEAGELSLEDSLMAFEEGIGLVRRGEKLLSEAEKRIEQLLNEGGADHAAPLELPASPQDPKRPAAAKPRADPEDDDTPF